MNQPDPPNPPVPPVQIQVEIDDATAQGIYTNLALVAHTETEFLFDFLFVQPQQPKAKVRARIISSPTHTKRFFLALRENLTRYEVRFGEIKVPEDGPGPRGTPHE